MHNRNFTIDNPTRVAFKVDHESRTIRGLALPFGDVADNGAGRWTFPAGALTWGKVKVLDGHDWSRAVGTGTLEETAEGLELVAKIARGARGDEALALAADGVYDGLSVGLGQDLEYVLKDDGVYHVTAGTVLEVSLTPLPAFERAAVTSVAASAAQSTNRKESAMPDDASKVEAPQGFDAAAFAKQVEDAVTAKLEKFQKDLTSLPPREKQHSSTRVAEQLPYRFDGNAGQHSFLADIVAAKFGGSEAKQRLDAFMGEVFANEIATTDVNELNPTVNRPELFVPALHYSRPLWNLVTTGGLDSVTAFTIPKWKQNTGNPAANHTQGTEPTNFKVETDVVTVTPTPVSGLAIIRREVVDQGGNPNVDQIIWNEMIQSYFANIEAAIAAALNAVTTTEVELHDATTPYASWADKALVKALKADFAGLQFVKGGDRFRAVAAADDLYVALASAEDDNGRPLLPVLGPTNADGSARASLESLQLGAKTITPAWALAALAEAKRSFRFVPESVYAWASAPKRLDIEYEVANVRIGLWGYKATAITREADVVPYDMTEADS